jgi:hypothetical protein
MAVEEVANLPDADQDQIGRRLLSHVEKLRHFLRQQNERALARVALSVISSQTAVRCRSA